MSFRRNILIFHQAALGDFVVTWPLAVALSRMFPQSRVVYVSASSKGKLADHVTTHLLHQLRQHRAIHSALSQILRSIAARGLAYRRAPADRVVIHPGAGNAQKCWPLENFLSLAEQMARRGTSVQMLLGE